MSDLESPNSTWSSIAYRPSLIYSHTEDTASLATSGRQLSRKSNVEKFVVDSCGSDFSNTVVFLDSVITSPDMTSIDASGRLENVLECYSSA